MSAADARLEARRRFGGVDWIKESCRDARGTTRVEIVVRDVRYAARRLARDWRFTAAAVLILGLGIGANTAVFSLIDATLFRRPRSPIPIVSSTSTRSARTRPASTATRSPPTRTWRPTRDVFADTTAVLVPLPVGYLDRGALRSALVEHATPSYPSVLGLRPSLGRWFDAAEDRPGAPVVAVLGHESWRRKFDADPSIVGRTLPIDGVPVTIVGVGPTGHRATIDVGLVTDFWMPVSALLALRLPARGVGTQAARGGLLGQGAAARRRDRGAGAGGDGHPRPATGGRVSDRGSRQGHLGRGVARRAHPSAAGRPAHRGRDDPAGDRRPGAGHRRQQPRDAAAGPRHGPRQGSLAAPGARRQPRPADPAPADREPAAGARRLRRRLRAGLVGGPRRSPRSTCRSSST